MGAKKPPQMRWSQYNQMKSEEEGGWGGGNSVVGQKKAIRVINEGERKRCSAKSDLEDGSCK